MPLHRTLPPRAVGRSPHHLSLGAREHGGSHGSVRVPGPLTDAGYRVAVIAGPEPPQARWDVRLARVCRAATPPARDSLWANSGLLARIGHPRCRKPNGTRPPRPTIDPSVGQGGLERRVHCGGTPAHARNGGAVGQQNHDRDRIPPPRGFRERAQHRDLELERRRALIEHVVAQEAVGVQNPTLHPLPERVTDT